MNTLARCAATTFIVATGLGLAGVGGATVAAAQVGEFPSYHWCRVVRAGRDVLVLDAPPRMRAPPQPVIAGTCNHAGFSDDLRHRDRSARTRTSTRSSIRASHAAAPNWRRALATALEHRIGRIDADVDPANPTAASVDRPYAATRGCAAMSAMGDIDEIKQVKYRYLRALDTKHWDEFADTLTEDVVGDYDARSASHTTSPTATPSSSSCARRCRPTSSPSTASPTPRSPWTATKPSATWYLQDRVIVPDFNFMLIGAAFYHDRYRNTADGWRISRDRLRPHLRRDHVDGRAQLQAENWSGA